MQHEHHLIISISCWNSGESNVCFSACVLPSQKESIEYTQFLHFNIVSFSSKVQLLCCLRLSALFNIKKLMQTAHKTFLRLHSMRGRPRPYLHFILRLSSLPNRYSLDPWKHRYCSSLIINSNKSSGWIKLVPKCCKHYSSDFQTSLYLTTLYGLHPPTIPSLGFSWLNKSERRLPHCIGNISVAQRVPLKHAFPTSRAI